MLKLLLRLQLTIEGILFHEQAQDQPNESKTRVDRPNNLEGIGVTVHQIRLDDALRHGLDDLHQGTRIDSVVASVSGDGAVGENLLHDLILEDDTAHSDTNHLPERAHEDEETHSSAHILVVGCSLLDKGQSGKQEAGTDTSDDLNDDPFIDWAVGIPQVFETIAETCEDPTGPHGPSILAGLGHNDADDHTARSDGECGGEQRDAGNHGAVALCCFKIEGSVVETAPKDHAMEQRRDIDGGGSDRLCDSQRDERFLCKFLFPNNKEGHACGA